MRFHQIGIQALAFNNESDLLVSVGVREENSLAIWDLEQGLVIKSHAINHPPTNMIKVDPFVEG